MTWPTALSTFATSTTSLITGKGTIDGDGPSGGSLIGICAPYDPKGCAGPRTTMPARPRLILIQNRRRSSFGGGILLKRSGFWTMQILYSHDVHIDGVTIRNNEGGRGPARTASILTLRANFVEHADIDVTTKPFA